MSNINLHPFEWISSGDSEGTSRHLRKAISKCFPLFSTYVHYVVADEVNAYFWEDIWLGDSPFALYSLIYTICLP